MSKHTPGPWKIVWGDVGDAELSRTAREIVAPDGFSPVSIEGGLFPYEPSRRFDRDEIEANARLIAAAPEMLEALVGLELLARDLLLRIDGGRAERSCRLPSEILAARDAIEKARGEK